MDKDKINGYGAVLRFITPILIVAIGWLMTHLITDIKDDLKEIKSETKTVITGMTNHLEHHRILEVSLAERLAAIETMLRKNEQ